MEKIQDKQQAKRDTNVSAIVPSWVDDILRRIAFEKRIGRSEVVSDILVEALLEEALLEEEPDAESHD